MAPSLAERSKAGMKMWQEAKKRVAAAPQGTEFKVDWCTSWSASEFQAEYGKILDQAINARAGVQFKGRKFDPDYQIKLIRDKNRLQDIHRRIRVYQFESDEDKSRFSHLLADPND